MVPRTGTHRVQESAVHPRDERAVELSRPAEAVHVVLDIGHEDVLHLQVAAGVEQRRSIRSDDEAFTSEIRDEQRRSMCGLTRV